MRKYTDYIAKMEKDQKKRIKKKLIVAIKIYDNPVLPGATD